MIDASMIGDMRSVDEGKEAVDEVIVLLVQILELVES